MEPMKVLIAYDDSECSRAMLVDLKQAGLPAEASAIVLSFAEVWMTAPEDVVARQGLICDDEGNVVESHSISEFHEAMSIAHEGCDRVRQIYPHWSVSCEAHADAATWGTMEKVRDWNPDLVVVGSHGRSALGRLIHGSVGQKLLSESPCSVRIARAPYGDQPGGLRIIVAVDGSPESKAAVTAVASRAWPAGTAVRVLSVYDQPAMDVGSVTMTAPGIVGYDDADIEAVENHGRLAVDELNRAGLPARAIFSVGSPAARIQEEAERWGADAIFIGARGHRLLERTLLGSVSNAVATRAQCAVEVVRIPHRR
jgi:nucleotide-binding universal stress UspA family protein